MSAKNGLIIKDIIIIIASIIVAILLVKTGLLDAVFDGTREMHILSSFIAGLFFTSIFTTAPAIVTLGHLAADNSVWLTAIFGAFGALIGDLILFYLIKDKFAPHFMEISKHNSVMKKVRALFRMKLFRWLSFAIGGIILASPLPDELGISILGFSKTKLLWFVPLSLIFNFIGILVIGLLASL